MSTDQLAIARGLRKAVKNKDKFNVSKLLNEGADPNDPVYWSDDWAGLPPLHEACESGDLDMVETLVQRGAKLDKGERKQDRTPFHIACENGHTEVVKFLASKPNCNIDARNKRGLTGLQLTANNLYAAESYFDTFYYLINNHARCGTGTNKENSKLICAACFWGKLEIVKHYREELNVDPNKVTGRNNKSPLHEACDGGRVEVVKYLVDQCKCDLVARDESKKTPLHWACIKGDKRVIKYLLKEKNCDTNVLDRDKKKPSDWCKIHSFHSELFPTEPDLDSTDGGNMQPGHMRQLREKGQRGYCSWRLVTFGALFTCVAFVGGVCLGYQLGKN